jgi:hypothetical protein
MPASVAREELRGVKLLPALFWSGVGLTPIAALLLLIGSGTGSIRFAVVLVLVSMVLIGVSITLRRESESVRTELQETIFDEIDVMRGDVRNDIGHAVQATHRAFGEKMQYLLDQLEATRAELQSTRGQLEALHHASPGRAGAQIPGQRQGVPPGLVRHTETVQVTTRHTVMDPHEERAGAHGSRQAIHNGQNGHSYGDDSWSDQRLRDQLERRREASEPISPSGWRESPEERWAAPVSDERNGMRAGDRWASLHSDDRGREFRVGERRAAMHSDGYGGTELRIEDRWAAVRREHGLDGPGWGSGYDDRDYDRDYDRDHERHERRAITGPERQARWSDHRDHRDHRDDWDRYR